MAIDIAGPEGLERQVAEAKREIERLRQELADATLFRDRLPAIAERLGVSQAGHNSLTLLRAVEDAIRLLVS